MTQQPQPQPQPQRPVRSFNGDDLVRIVNLVGALNAFWKTQPSYNTLLDIELGELRVCGVLYLVDNRGLVKKIDAISQQGFAMVEPTELDHQNWWKDANTVTILPSEEIKASE